MAGGAAAGGAAVGGLAAKLGGVGLAAAGTAVAIPAPAVIGIGIAAGAGVGGLVAWMAKKAIDSRAARAAPTDEDADHEYGADQKPLVQHHRLRPSLLCQGAKRSAMSSYLEPVQPETEARCDSLLKTLLYSSLPSAVRA